MGRVGSEIMVVPAVLAVAIAVAVVAAVALSMPTFIVVGTLVFLRKRLLVLTPVLMIALEERTIVNILFYYRK